ncbi:tetratricopeptide repeat protein [Crenalkalicoccus roseus]|uniref:tetratricopeptide repeat protein n=1 Tax=Crenalkalicoccus roseus TaxID=1485588 RepID=UPI0010808D3A|nr:tetratricopeptide repeat protein [Crenalkalicoccus roseus]
MLARQPLHHLARVELATECCALGEHDRARALLREVLRAAPGHLQALLALGETERRAGAPQAALAAFEAAARHHPALPRPLVEMAREWRRLGKPEEADRLLHRALVLAPECRPALLALAESALETGQQEKALALYRQVIATAADSLEAHLGAAEALQALGRIAEAMALLEEAEGRLGASPGLAARRVALLHLAGRWPEALALARRAAAAAPWHFGLWLERCQIELRLGEPEEVAACLEAAPAASAEQRARIEECRGRAAERAWRLEAARVHHEAALRHAPALAAAHDGLVRIGLLRLDLAAARHHLRASAARRQPAARGGLARAMETLAGQVLEDALLDEPAVARLRTLRDLPPAARIARHCDIVREHPESTAAALCLLLSLREAGLLDPPAPADGPSPIPRRIGQYWDEPEPPAEVAALMRSWPEANPGHVVQVFDHAAAQAYLAAHHPPAVLRAYLRARHPAMRADILRLAWLAREGGVWADADDRCLAPLETLPLAGARFLAYQEPLASLGNNLLGAVPDEPVIRLALALAVEAVNRGDQDSLWLATGPGLLSRAFARTLAAWEGAPEAWLRGRVVLPAARLFRAVAIGCHAPYRRTERHWLHPGAGRTARAC